MMELIVKKEEFLYRIEKAENKKFGEGVGAADY